MLLAFHRMECALEFFRTFFLIHLSTYLLSLSAIPITHSQPHGYLRVSTRNKDVQAGTFLLCLHSAKRRRRRIRLLTLPHCGAAGLLPGQPGRPGLPGLCPQAYPPPTHPQPQKPLPPSSPPPPTLLPTLAFSKVVVTGTTLSGSLFPRHSNNPDFPGCQALGIPPAQMPRDPPKPALPYPQGPQIRGQEKEHRVQEFGQMFPRWCHRAACMYVAVCTYIRNHTRTHTGTHTETEHEFNLGELLVTL